MIGLFRHSLARDIAIILGVKLAIIIFAAIFLFGTKQRPHVDTNAMFQHLFSRWPH